MGKNVLKLAAALAWAAVCVSAATPVGAMAQTFQTGTTAACSNSYQSCSVYDSLCNFQINYAQHIRFASVSCSTGGCGGDGYTLTDMVYTVGRKPASFVRSGCVYGYIYNLDSCAC